MSNLKVKVWDVEHGACIYAVAPNGKKVIIDCGNSSDISPAYNINTDHEKKKLDYLVISHPHQDHITDLLNVDEKFNVKVFRCNEKISKSVMKQDNPNVFDPPNDIYIDKYYEYTEKFTSDVDWSDSPKNPSWGNGCTFHTFSNSDTELTVNDLSVITFIKFENQTILYGGDLLEKGWQVLLTRKKFCEYLSKTTIFIAAHHGHDSGYCLDIFKYFTPSIIICSVGRHKDQAISKYRQHTEGMTVYNRIGDNKHCFVLTTRNNGNIDMVLYPDSTMKPKITVDTF